MSCFNLIIKQMYLFISDVRIDDNLVSQLLDMGFPLEACQKAVYYTNNGGLEVATNWVMEHMGDDGKFTSDF